MVAEKRREKLLEVVRQRGFASLKDLKTQLDVSESTIRRDLELLEEAGAAQRRHGGVFYSGPSPKLPHFDQRQSAQWEKKQAIAERAAALIEDGDTVLLDGGSTTYELAQQLIGRPLQIVTNSLPVANLFASSDTVDLIVIGGYVHSRTGVSLGPYANEMLSKLNVRRSVLSVAAVHEDGYYNSNALLVETEQAMMRAADEVLVVADSTKFGRRSLAHIGGLGSIDAFIVDHEITAAWREKLTAAGVNVYVAQPRSEKMSDSETCPTKLS